MSDKGFELATLLYTVYNFPVHREGSAATDQPEVEQPSNSSVVPFVPNMDTIELVSPN
jgi:hypothetical protein